MSGEDQLIQIAIVSDDKKLAGALRALTGVCCASMGKLCRCALVSDLEAFAASLCPDMYAVVFSSFTGGEGDLFSLRKAAPRAGVILVSGDAASAVNGYMIEAAGFLTVPVEYNLFASAFKRACRRVRRERDKSILLEGGAWCRRVYAKDVQFVEVNGRFLIYHLFGGSVTTRGQLCGEEKLLEQMGFYRCSAKYMVNLRYVERFDGENVYVGGSKIPVSRRKKEDFSCLLGRSYSGGALAYEGRASTSVCTEEIPCK